MVSRQFHSLSDETIDAVAHRLTDVEPPARLRANVLARLGERAPRQMWWIPAAGVAAAMLGAIVAWPHPQSPALPALPAIAAASAPFAATAVALVEVAAQSSPRPNGARVQRVSAESAPPSENAIPALAELTPLAIDGIQPQPLSIPLLVISPLSTPANNAGGDGGK